MRSEGRGPSPRAAFSEGGRTTGEHHPRVATLTRRHHCVKTRFAEGIEVGLARAQHSQGIGCLSDHDHFGHKGPESGQQVRGVRCEKRAKLCEVHTRSEQRHDVGSVLGPIGVELH